MKTIKFLLLFPLCSALMTLSAANWNPPSLTPVKIKVNKKAGSMTFFANKKSSCVIVVPGKEDKPCRAVTHVQSFPLKRAEYKKGVAGFAALELQMLIKKVSGAVLPIITADKPIPKGKTPIFVGMSSAAKKYGFDNKNVKAGGFKIEVKRNAAAILNAPYPKKPVAGWDGLYTVVYGVYDFAERFLDCRFYYPGPDGMITPAAKKLVLPALVYSDAPEISMRILYSWNTVMPGYKNMDPLKIALRYRAGGAGLWSTQPPPHWRTPVKEGLKPAVDAAGKVIRTNPVMPCFGNPASADVFVKNIRKWENIIKILPPDHPIKCQCRFCSKLYNKKGPYHCAASPVYNTFVKRVAEKMKKSHPGKQLYFTAYYNYTSPAPGLTLPDNTMVQLCLMYGQNAYHDPWIKRQTDQWIRDWNRITGKPVFVYVYPNWPGQGRSPFPRQYYHNIKNFLLANRGRIGGLFSDGPNQGGIQAIQGGFYAFTLPSTYCEFKLLWNPEFDVDAAVKDMCLRMYGKGGPAMHKIVTTMAKVWESKATTGHKSMYVLGDYAAGGIAREVVYSKIIKPELVSTIKRDLDKAYKSVKKNSAEYRRIDLLGQTLKLFFKHYEYYRNPRSFSQKKVKVARVPYVADLEKKFNLPQWKNIPKHNFVNAYLSHGPKPDVRTTVQFAYDKGGVIYKFNMQEPELDKVLTAPRVNIWGGDCLEVFTEYTPGTVYHLTVNLKKEMRDRFIGKFPGKRRNMPYRYFKKGKDNWEFMLYLPFVTLDATVKFTPSRIVRFNVSRTRRLKSGYSHVSRWNTTYGRAHADPSAFGVLQFEKSSK